MGVSFTVKTRKVRYKLSKWADQLAKLRVLARGYSVQTEITRQDWAGSLINPLGFYLSCYCYFHRWLPNDLKRHRRYFTKQDRGFGDDCFHVMWFLLYREFLPTHFLEIGVYRGQMISLISLLQKRFGQIGQVAGISPFSSAGDSICDYKHGIDYHKDTLDNFAHFALPQPKLYSAYSTESQAVEVISSKLWDWIYIDGNHDYDVVKADWENCSTHVKPGGLIILDDAGTTTAYQPPRFAFRGHIGPSRVASEVDRSEFQEILQVGHNRVFQMVKGG